MRFDRKRLLLWLMVAFTATPVIARAQGFAYPPGPGSGGGGTFSGGTITAPILGPTGCATPAYSFTLGPTSGGCEASAGVVRYQSAAAGDRGVLDLSTPGVETQLSLFSGGGAVVNRISLTAAQQTFLVGSVSRFTLSTTAATFVVPILAPSGSAAAPPYSFSTETNLGIFRSGAGLLGFASGGFEIMRMSAASFFVTAETRLGSANQFTWSSNAVAQNAAADTGLARSAAGVVKVTDGGAGNGSFYSNNSGATSPGFQVSRLGTNPAGMSTDAGGGIFFHNDNGFATTRNIFGMTATGHALVYSAGQFQWSSGEVGAVSADTGLARVAAANARATNGSTGLGYLTGGQLVEANAATKSPTVIESGELYTNTGDADGSTINLPNDPTIGTWFTVTATVAQDITLAPAAGETVMFGNTVCGTSFVIGGAATGIGDSVTVVAATGGSGAVWITTAFSGTPTCTP